jgi:hypothetical protein
MGWLSSFVALVALAVAGGTACNGRERATPLPDASAPTSPSAVASARPPVPVPVPVPVRVAASGPAPELGFLPPAVRTPAVVATVPVTDWVWKTYQGDRFTLLFPGEPKVTDLPPEDDKVGYTEARVEVPGGQVSFAAGFSEHSKEQVAKPEAFLDEHITTPRRGTTEVLTKRSITLSSGQPGRVIILRRNISGTPLRVYSRLYLVGVRLYSLIVSTLDVGGVGEDVVKKFMDSFKVL